MPAGTTITGGCLCGAVRYAASEPPLGTRTCWCRLCQYLAAGGATMNLIFAVEAVTITGALGRYETVADSGNHMTRTFCRACGTQIGSASAENAAKLVLRAGTLDDPGWFEPQATIWAAQAPAWTKIDADLPRHEGQPPPIA